MIRFIIYRPIGTCVTAFTLMVLGAITIWLLPVSLLPDIPVPEITVQVRYPNVEASQIEQSITLQLRNQLLQMDHLDDLEATTSDGQVVVKMRFEFGTNIDLAYLETNEKIDALMSVLPRDLERPLVIKAGAGDIPVFQLNVMLSSDSADFAQLSELCENVIKRRLEQLQEVSYVDMTGQVEPFVLIRADSRQMLSAGITIEDLATALKNRNIESRNVTIREGIYEYSIRIGDNVRDIRDVEKIFLTVGGEARRVVPLSQVAHVSVSEQSRGLHMFKDKRAIGMGIIKHSDAQLLHMREELHKLIAQLRRDYPALRFELSQDQTELLSLSIGNLVSSLLTGAVLTFIMIFFFMKERKVLLIIGLVIPVSLSITMLGFYLLDLSINIVSLAGLVLGIGEIIDSSIIIIENIEQHREQQKSIAQSCIDGAEEVIRPLFTSVLTNSAVFIPLLFLSGIAGALFWDQAVSVTLALGISLLISYSLVPVLYRLLYRNSDISTALSHVAGSPEGSGQMPVMRFFYKLYDAILNFSFRFPRVMISFWVLLLAGSTVAFLGINKAGMPHLSRTEMEMFVDWNEPINLSENLNRISDFTHWITDKNRNGGAANKMAINSYIGTQSFLVNSRFQQNMAQTKMIMKLGNAEAYQKTVDACDRYFKERYPRAFVRIRPSQNVFEQLFQTQEPLIQVQLYDNNKNTVPSYPDAGKAISALRNAGYHVPNLPSQQNIVISADLTRLTAYQIDMESFYQVLKTAFGQNNIGMLRSDKKQIPILLRSDEANNLDSTLNNTMIQNPDGGSVSIRSFLTYHQTIGHADLKLGKEGPFISLAPEIPENDIPGHLKKIGRVLSGLPFLSFDFKGTYFRDQNYLSELIYVLCISIVMLFFILAAQFESLTQPFIVLLTILFGSSGALVGLYLTGSSINMMSAIGLIVLIGLLDNDSILKIDTMNRSRSHLSLIDSIKEGGSRRLQSQLMTYLTTVLGLLPVLWATGLGAELQKPLAITIIFGMTVGVFTSWTFIPLTYYFLYRKQIKEMEYA